MINNISQKNILCSEVIAKLRNKKTKPPVFRQNLRELGIYLAYEASKYLSKKAHINGSCKIEGVTKIDEYEVNGSAKHTKNLYSEGVEINGSLRTLADVIIANELDVGGSVAIKGSLKCKKVDVGGSIKVGEEISCENIDTGGSLKAGIIKAKNAFLGGSGKIIAGEIERILEVGGSLRSEEDLVGNEIEVNGSLKIGGSLKVKTLEVNGSTTINNNFYFTDVSISGSVNVENEVKGVTIELNGSMNNNNSVELENTFTINGKFIGKKLKADMIQVAGKIEIDEANAREIIIEKKSKAKGRYKANKIVVKEYAEVDEIIVDEAFIADNAKIGHLEIKHSSDK